MKDKDIILITGGAGNIAKAVIKKYLAHDCIVIAIDIKNKIETNVFKNHPNFCYYQCDVTDVDSIKNFKKTIENKYGKLTHIISMAGDALGTDTQGIEKVTIEDIDKTIKLNLSSHIYITTILLPLLKNEKKDKTITYMSSINALRAYDCPVYSASKAALFGLCRGCLVDMGKLNIRVNTISPGTVLRPNEVLRNQMTNGEVAKKRPKTKFQDFAINEDIADAVFSITHIMKKMVGQNIVIDAGQMA